ncbi:MAG: hypothetical protein AAGH60_15030 [Pseudomonadota bacterium]
MRYFLATLFFVTLIQNAAAQSLVDLGPRAPLPEFLDAPLETGTQRSFTQLSWDDEAQTLDRKTYAIWDLLAQDGLVLTWEPAGVAPPSGLLEGSGILSWRAQDRLHVSPEALVAQYRGVFSAGYATGQGQLWHRSGLNYRGMWRAGLFHGDGWLQWPDGQEYRGSFIDGLPYGQGMMLFADGAIFFGDFTQGRPDGTGILYPVDRPAERVIWPAHADRPSVALPIEGPDGTAHLQQVQQTQGDVSLALSLSPNSQDFGSGATYRSESVGPILRVTPGDASFMEAWRGTTALTTGETPRGFFSGHLPIAFIVQLENRSVDEVQVVAMFLEVDESPADLTPALWAERPSCAPGESGIFKIERLSGAFPTNIQIEGGFPAAFDERVISPVAFTAIENWPLVIDFRQLIGGFGGSMPDLLNGFVNCQGLDPSQCIENLRNQGAFGVLTNEVYRRGTCLYANFAGRISYDWRDETGALQSQSRTLNARIGLGDLRPRNLAGAEQGGGLDQIPEAFELVIGESRYRLPRAINSQTPAGRAQRWEFYVLSPQSTNARFRVVFQLADGREIRSRDVELTYYRAE